MPQIPSSLRPGRLAPIEYVAGVLRGERVILARAITLCESELPADRELAAAVLDGILPHTGKARRVGVTGPPGAGKSTFIDALGMHLIQEQKETLAVLSVDPSSPVSRGSILGDKTRMERLAAEEKAFIRPSPSGGVLGGVARRTREAILLCEAAGYRNIFVETVGVGQSETSVRSMTDFFLLITMPGAGDELQGIKRGITELIDGIAINKADGDNQIKAQRAQAEYQSALRLFPASADGSRPRVLTVSSLTEKGIPQLWEVIRERWAQTEADGSLVGRRGRQSLAWMRELVAAGLNELFRADPTSSGRLAQLEAAVEQGTVSPPAAAAELLKTFACRGS